MIPLSDVRRAVEEEGFAEAEGYGPGDVDLMKKALENRPRKTADRRRRVGIKPAAGLGEIGL